MIWPKLFRQPRTLWVLAALVTLLVAVAGLTWRWVEKDRAELYSRFSHQRMVALSLVVKEVESSIKDVTNALRLIANLVPMVPRLPTGVGLSAKDLRALLITLLGSSRTFRGIALEHGSSESYVWISDPTRHLPGKDRIDEAVRSTFARLSENGAHGALLSPTIEVGESYFRVFATRLPSPWRHVALVVDMQPHVGTLRLAAADPQTMLLVIGPRGTPHPVSDPVLREAARGTKGPYFRTFGQMLKLMRSGERGTLRIHGSEAARLALGHSSAIAAFQPIHMPDGSHFSVATVTSLAAIKHHERSLLVRFGLGVGLVMILLLGLSGYILRTGYRHSATLEKLRHAEVEAQLHELAQRTLESIPSGVLLLDGSDRITDANQAIRARISGDPTEQTLSDVLATSRPGDLDRIRRLIDEARQSQAPRSVVAERFSMPSGEGHFRIHAVPLRPASPHADVLVVVDDITELKTLQEQLLRAEKLSTIGTLSAGIAHEIGTPLSVVRGRSEYILSKLEPDSPHGPGLRTVIEQTDRIVRTVRELLDFSRPGSSSAVSTDCVAVLNRCVELLRFEAQRRQLTIITEVATSLPPLSANPDQLQQVLVNLLMNAMDASPPHGEISVSAQVAEKAAVDQGEPARVRLEIRDQGAGIAPSILHSVFDPFFTTKKRGQGTGLGLFITAHIVQSHGGKIDLESAPGEGTRTILMWPIHGSSEAPAAR